jgi:hypothetical protein
VIVGDVLDPLDDPERASQVLKRSFNSSWLSAQNW